MNNLILRSDSYKHSHAALYPAGITGMSSYITTRKPDRWVMLFGLQMWLRQMLDQRLPITCLDVDEASSFVKEHGLPFREDLWEKIIEDFDGFPPIRIYAVPEGLPIRSQVPLVRVECTEPEFFWLAMFIETDIQRAVWYPSSVATQDHEHYMIIKRHWSMSCDDLTLMKFALHDFGGRGVTCSEQAEIGGAAHLVHFDGSDTLEGIMAAAAWYNHPMPAYSVPAAEHSVQCAYGPYQQDEYIRHVLNTYAKPGAIVSIVLDAYDVLREANRLCTTFKDQIIQSGARIVFRPDSGNAEKNICEILNMQARAFGKVINKKGFMEIQHVGVIQGDGVNKVTIDTILQRASEMGFAASNLVFGSGGALLQKLDRDTYGFAQKASAIYRGGRWEGIYKDPSDDPSKRSEAGRREAYRSKMNNEFLSLDIDHEINDEYEPMMRLVWDTGALLEEDSLETIRKRART